MNQSSFKGSRRHELERRLAHRQAQVVWHFGPRQSPQSGRRDDAETLVDRMRRKVFSGAE